MIIFFPYQDSGYLKIAIIFSGIIIFIFKQYSKENLNKFKSLAFFGLYVFLTSLLIKNSFLTLLNGFFFISLYFNFQFYLNLKKNEVLFFLKIFLYSSFLISLLFILNTYIFKSINYEKDGASFYWIYYGHGYISSLIIFPMLFSFLYMKNHFFSFIFLISFMFSLSKGMFYSLFFSILFFVNKKYLDFFLKLLILIIFLFAVFIYFSKSITGFNKTWKIGKARIYYATEAIQIFKKNYLIGIGFGNYNYIGNNSILSTKYIHNYYLQVLVESGIIGGLIYIKVLHEIFFFLLSKIKKNKYVVLKIVIFSSMINNLINIDWNLPVLYLYFWIFIAMFVNKNINNFFSRL